VTITASAGSNSRTLVTGNQASGSIGDTPSQTTSYTASVSGAGGSTSQTLTVQVVQAVKPQITQFSASPTTISAGQTTTLTWATTNATAVTISPSITGEDTNGLTPS